MKLGGWQRVGVVLSILWVLGAGYERRSYFVTQAYSALSNRTAVCIDKTRAETNRFNECQKEATGYFEKDLGRGWDSVVITAFAPIPLAWLLVYLLVRTWRWVRAGFT